MACHATVVTESPKLRTFPPAGGVGHAGGDSRVRISALRAMRTAGGPVARNGPQARPSHRQRPV
jgi:hypothetical protein